MRYPALVLFGISFATPISASAQTDEEQVVGVAEALFQAMQDKDAAAIRSVMLEDARLLAVDSRQQPSAVAWATRDQFVDRITNAGAELLERSWDPKVRIDGDIAQLWTTYDFHRDGQFSHCGVDAFHLVRTADGWRIAHITYNRRTEDCYSPLGRPVP